VVRAATPRGLLFECAGPRSGGRGRPPAFSEHGGAGRARLGAV